MEKVKNVFSKCGSWIKSHAKIVIAVVVIVLVAIIAVNLANPQKRAVNKYLSALNSCDADKIEKAMNLEATVAWKNAQSSSYSYYLDSTSDDDKNVVEKFKDNLDEVEDDDVDSYKDSLDDQYDKDDKGKLKYKLEKIVYTTKAKDDKDLKKVVAKVKLTSKPSDDDDDDDDEKIWSKEKKFTSVQETYMTFYVYKGKVIGTGYSY